MNTLKKYNKNKILCTEIYGEQKIGKKYIEHLKVEMFNKMFLTSKKDKKKLF